MKYFAVFSRSRIINCNCDENTIFMALHSWDRSMAEMSPCIKERSIITLGIIQQHWTPSDIERCLTTLESSKTRTNKSHGSRRRTSSASKPLSTHLINKTIITDLILGIANAGLQTIRSLKTSTSRARKCCFLRWGWRCTLKYWALLTFLSKGDTRRRWPSPWQRWRGSL